MSTTSGWIANMRSPLSHQNHFASIQMVKDSLTPPTQTRSSMRPSRNVPKSASFQATSVACCLKTCPTASPTSLATSNMPTQPRHQKPQWLRKVSCLCSSSLVITPVHILLFLQRENIWLTAKKKCSSFSTCAISLIAELLLPCSAWSVLLQSCSGLVLTLVTLPMLLEIHWLWTRRQTAAYVNTAPTIIWWLLLDSLKLCVCTKCNELIWVYVHYIFGMPQACLLRVIHSILSTHSATAILSSTLTYKQVLEYTVEICWIRVDFWQTWLTEQWVKSMNVT